MTQSNPALTDRDLVAYAFMASLNDGSKDLMRTVFMPMFKRAISEYSTSAPGGKDIDAKQAFLNMYGLDVPIYTIRRMLQDLETELSRHERSQFGLKVFEKGKSFTLNQYTFTEEEVKYQAESRNTNALKAAFGEFIKAHNFAANSLPTISEFIALNRKKLAGFFSRDERSVPYDVHGLAQYSLHAEFFQMINEQNQALYEVAEHLFIGSVIGAYLEAGFDLSPKFHNGTAFVLDTQFVLRALDLQQEEETRPVVEVLEMIHNSGGKITVLDVTLQEIEKNIKNASDYFFDNPLVAEIGNTSIVHACHRRKMSHTDLDLLLANVSEEISRTSHAVFRQVTAEIKSTAEQSQEHEALKQLRHKPSNALHDIICILFVRRLRGGTVMSYQKANSWFVSNNSTLYSFNLEHASKGVIPEVITPEELASLLWLQNPSALNKSVARVGIEELVAQAMSSSLVPVETLSDLNDNLKKIDSISPQQYAIVATALASRSVESLRNLNALAKSNHAEFTSTVLEMISQEKARSEANVSSTREISDRATAFELKYRDVMQKISTIEQNLILSQRERHGIEEHVSLLRFERDYLKNQLLARNRTIRSLLILLASLVLVWAFSTFLPAGIVHENNHSNWKPWRYLGVWQFLSQCGSNV